MQAFRNDSRAQIVLLPSFDYEVFHGRSFSSDDETLFAPTERLLSRASEFGIPLTLFADVLSVPAHRRAKLEGFVDAFERQLCAAVRGGHDVQLHIHAHWAGVARDGDQWVMENPDITLADLEPALARNLIAKGADYLRRLLSPIDAGYRCLAFRAGGLALQPREKLLIHMLHDEGIEIDSSIAAGLRMKLDTLAIDYTDVPQSSNWMISRERGLRGAGEDALLEVPIATFSMPLLQRIEFMIRRARAFKKRRGAGISRARRQTRLANALTLLRVNLRYVTTNPVFLFSADTKGFTRGMLVKGFQRYVAAHESRGASRIFVSMINHPKLMFRDEESLFFDTLRELKQIYGERLTFATYQDVAREFAAGKVTLSA